MSSNSSPTSAYASQPVPSHGFDRNPSSKNGNQPAPSQDFSAYNMIAVISDPHQIYLVQHRATGKVCIKKILDVYNINIYARLYHDHITGTPEIISYQESEGQLTVIEEYVAGTSLQEKIDDCTLTEIDILSYMIDICTILDQLHGFMPPIVHRDIKPSNVIITKYNRAVLLDFNAAKFYSADSNEDTVLLGTQGYASPEQYGFGASTPQSDIYSLGILLKEMLSSAQLSNPALNTVINKCTQMVPGDRYATVSVLKKNLIRYLRTALKRQARTYSPTANVSNSNLPLAYTSKNTAETLRVTNARNLVARRFYFSLPDLHDYTLPGFRTGTPRNIMIASAVYLLMAAMCASLTVSSSETVGELWLYRIFTFEMMIAVVFSIFNYRNIQRLMPLCKHKSVYIQAIGIAILVFFLLFISLCLFFFIHAIFIP